MNYLVHDLERGRTFSAETANGYAVLMGEKTKMAVIPSTPSNTTRTTERRKPAPSAPSKQAPSAPSESKNKDRFIDKALEKARKGGGDADKGADATKAATDKVKKDPVNNAIIGAVETVKSTARDIDRNVRETARNVDKTVRETAETVDKKAREIGTAIAKDVGEVVGKAAEAVKPLVEPTIREIKEAGTEIGDAGKKFGTDWLDNLNPFDHEEVQEVRDSDLDGVNKGILITKEVIENGIEGGIENVTNAAKLGWEVLEGGAEILINNPVNTAVVEGGKAAVEGIKDLGSSIGSWFGDRISGGAEGAVKAGKTAADTGKTIAERSAAQRAENVREVGGAAKDLAGDFIDSLNPFDHAEVEEVRNSDLDGVNKSILITKEVIENGIQSGWNNVVNVGNLGKEVAEAGVENIITGVENAGDAISGGFKTAGDFVGGLFG